MTSPSNRGLASFRLLGVPVRVDLTWLLVAVLFAWSLAMGAFPELYRGLPQATYWWMAVVSVAGLAVSIVLHEMAHTLVGRRFGVPVGSIRLFAFGGVAEMNQEPTTPRAEFWMSLAGPVFSLVLAAVLWALAGLAAGGSAGVHGVLRYLATLNIALAVFNMLPAFPLDGGRVLRAALWARSGQAERATMRAARIGQIFGVAIMAIGALAVLTGEIGGLWWVLLGWFLRMLASSERGRAQARRFLQGVPVRDLMSAEAQPMPADMTIRRFLDEQLLHARHEIYPVARAGALVGLVTPRDLLATPPERWQTTTLGEVCSPRAEIGVVQAADDSASALETLRAEGQDRAVVEDGGKIVGLLSLKDLLELSRLRAQFAPAQA